jgi:hypothetical protein
VSDLPPFWCIHLSIQETQCIVIISNTMLKLSEDEVRGLDAIYKGAAVAALIFGGLWTLTQYFLHRAEERETAAIEARKPYLEKRFQVYNEVVLAAATIVTSADPAEVKKAKANFWILYSGPLTLFEDRDIRNAVQQFGVCLKESAACDELTIRERAENIAAFCRQSVGEGWGVRFPSAPRGLRAIIQ